jgi:proteic killer suppression protein
MIKSFKDRETENIFQGTRVKNMPIAIQRVARRKLRILDNINYLKDLRISPAFQLEKLKGNLSKFYCIHINTNWRIIFIWKNKHALETSIIEING